jgi:hypothetical protein
VEITYGRASSLAEALATAANVIHSVDFMDTSAGSTSAYRHGCSVKVSSDGDTFLVHGKALSTCHV